MDKLRDSPFFGERLISFAASLLNGTKQLSPLNEFEKKLMKHTDQLKQLNSSIDGGLVKLLHYSKNSIPPHTALRLMLYLQKKNLTEVGHQIVFFSARDNRILTDEEINELVRDLELDPDLSVELYLALLDASYGAEEEKPRPPRGLNLPYDFQ